MSRAAIANITSALRPSRGSANQHEHAKHKICHGHKARRRNGALAPRDEARYKADLRDREVREHAGEHAARGAHRRRRGDDGRTWHQRAGDYVQRRRHCEQAQGERGRRHEARDHIARPAALRAARRAQRPAALVEGRDPRPRKEDDEQERLVAEERVLQAVGHPLRHAPGGIRLAEHDESERDPRPVVAHERIECGAKLVCHGGTSFWSRAGPAPSRGARAPRRR